MGKVFVDVGVSLDGYIAGPNRGAHNPLGDGGAGIHRWVFETQSFRQRLGLAGGANSPDDVLVNELFEGTGAYIMGRRMFDEGEGSWPEDPPFRACVFVLTHTARAAWPRKGGTTFFFVTEGISSALERAKRAAGHKDVRISGGAETVREFVAAGLVDEITLHLAPVLLGSGVRLFDHLGPGELKLEQVGVTSSALVTHLHYRVLR